MGRFSRTKKATEPKKAVGALLVRKSNILLGLRAPHKSFPNCWDMFGGHIEANETEEETLARELHEELGVHPAQFQKVQHLILDFDAGSLDIAVYLVTGWGDDEPVMMGTEHIGICWFSLDEVSNLTNLASNEIKLLLRAIM